MCTQERNVVYGGCIEWGQGILLFVDGENQRSYGECETAYECARALAEDLADIDVPVADVRWL